MSEANLEGTKKEKEVLEEKSAGDLKDSDQDNNDDENPMPSSNQEEEVIKKKYGGLIPKKPPLISKDHERAYFDSADWALGKQGGAQKPKGPLEALRPKLQPTQQHARSRRSPYAPSDEGEVDGCHINASPEHEIVAEDVGGDKSATAQDQSSH